MNPDIVDRFVEKRFRIQRDVFYVEGNTGGQRVLEALDLVAKLILTNEEYAEYETQSVMGGEKD